MAVLCPDRNRNTAFSYVFLPTSRDVIQVSNGHANERATEIRGEVDLPLLLALAGAKMPATPTRHDGRLKEVFTN